MSNKELTLDGISASDMATKMARWFGTEKAKTEVKFIIERDGKSNDPYWESAVPFWESVLEHLSK